MKYTLCAIAVALLLAGCGPNGSTVSGSLPTVPADIQQCFRVGVGKVPPHKLTPADVEALWKVDRVRAVALQRCGNRLLNWYGDLQKGWR